MRILFSVLLLHWMPLLLVAQVPVDSLKKRLSVTTGKKRALILNELSTALLQVSPDWSEKYNREALILSKTLDDATILAEAFLNEGQLFERKGKYELSLASLNNALQIYRSSNRRAAMAKTYNHIAKVLIRQSRYQEAENFIEKASTINDSLNSKEGMWHTYSCRSMLFEYQGEYSRALDHAIKALELGEESFPKLSVQLIESNHHLGINLWHLYKYDEALSYYLKALDIARKLDHAYWQAAISAAIGLLYYEQDLTDLALEHYFKALRTYQELGSKERLGTLNNNIGVAYTDRKDYIKALEHYQVSLEIRKSLGNSHDIIQSYGNIAEVYYQKRDYANAKQYYGLALEKAKDTGTDNFLGPIYRSLGIVNTATKDYEVADNYLSQAIFMEKKFRDDGVSHKTWEALAKLYEATGKYELAHKNYKIFISIRDSLARKKEIDRLNELRTRYEIDLKESQLAAQRMDLKILGQKRKIDALWRGILIASVILLGLFSFFLYRYQNVKNRRKEELIKQQRSLNKQLQEISQMKSQFFANISHEFRTPLTLILGPIDKLIEETQNAKNLQSLHLVKKNAVQLKRLINQLLDLSKAEDGSLNLIASQRNIVDLAKGVLFSFQSLADQKKVHLVFSCTEDEILVFYEPEKLEQVFSNLISNALKFTAAQGKVQLSLQRILKNDIPEVQITIEDSGMGISRDQLPHIFDRFFQANNLENPLVEGTGIGLAVAKELVVLHKGRISVTSEKGRGTTFNIFLPLGKAHLSSDQIRVTSVQADQSESTVDSAGPVIFPSAGEISESSASEALPEILVVEDHPDLREYISATFSKKYRVQVASNGLEGLKMATKQIPDLIVSDVMMPKLDGFQLCRKLKNDMRTSHIPIILLTAKNEEQDRLQGFQSEADDYLVKPFNTKELQARVSNLILLRKKLRQKFSTAVLLKPEEICTNSIDEDFLVRLKETMELEIGNERFGVKQLSKEIGMSRVHLHRKLQALLNITPTEFIQNFRLERAMDLLRQNAGTISEIAYDVGFSSPTYFSKCFKNRYHHSPRDVKINSGT